MTDSIYVVEDKNGDPQVLGFNDRFGARDSQRRSFPGGRIKSYQTAQDVRDAYPDARWIERLSDAEIEAVPA